MSATVDTALFASYFGGCAVVQASGRTFPVERMFLEDVYEMTGATRGRFCIKFLLFGVS
jgi:HrpA-like RNA helicase